MIVNGINIENTAKVHTGIISKVDDIGVTIEVSGRMGIIKMPMRGLICKNNPKVGDEVVFLMSLIEMRDDDYEDSILKKEGK